MQDEEIKVQAGSAAAKTRARDSRLAAALRANLKRRKLAKPTDPSTAHRDDRSTED
jgi:hypothetical protein